MATNATPGSAVSAGSVGQWIQPPRNPYTPIGISDPWQFQPYTSSSAGFGGFTDGATNRSGYNTGSNFNASSFGDVFAGITGGGNQHFNANQAEGFNPYQYTPVVQNLQRPDRAVLPLTPEEEYIRQLGLGSLLGERPGEDLAFQELLNTVGGMYLGPESNPYLADVINASGDTVSDYFNRSINDILSRAGVSGALGGSRAALLQGEALSDTARNFNQIISELLNENYQGERNRQLGAIPSLLQVEGLPTQRYAQALGLAGMPRELEQQELNFRISELLRQQNERFLPLQVGQSILGQRLGQTIPITGPNQSGLAGLGSLLSGVGSAASGLGNLFGGGGNNSIVNPLISGATQFGPGLFDATNSLFGGGIFDLLGGGGVSAIEQGLGGIGSILML